jgi:hypothetical protein
MAWEKMLRSSKCEKWNEWLRVSTQPITSRSWRVILKVRWVCESAFYECSVRIYFTSYLIALLLELSLHKTQVSPHTTHHYTTNLFYYIFVMQWLCPCYLPGIGTRTGFLSKRRLWVLWRLRWWLPWACIRMYRRCGVLLSWWSSFVNATLEDSLKQCPFGAK